MHQLFKQNLFARKAKLKTHISFEETQVSQIFINSKNSFEPRFRRFPDKFFQLQHGTALSNNIEFIIASSTCHFRQYLIVTNLSTLVALFRKQPISTTCTRRRQVDKHRKLPQNEYSWGDGKYCDWLKQQTRLSWKKHVYNCSKWRRAVRFEIKQNAQVLLRKKQNKQDMSLSTEVVKLCQMYK